MEVHVHPGRDAPVIRSDKSPGHDLVEDRADDSAVGDAVPEVKKAAHFVTKSAGGHGAIRDAVELILKSKGIWEAMIDKARA